MPEFRLAERADRSPTRCYFCGDHEGPFIDTFTDDNVVGAVWICAPNEERPGCLGQMARLAGCELPFDYNAIQPQTPFRSDTNAVVTL